MKKAVSTIQSISEFNVSLQYGSPCDFLRWEERAPDGVTEEQLGYLLNYTSPRWYPEVQGIPSEDGKRLVQWRIVGNPPRRSLNPSVVTAKSYHYDKAKGFGFARLTNGRKVYFHRENGKYAGQALAEMEAGRQVELRGQLREARLGVRFAWWEDPRHEQKERQEEREAVKVFYRLKQKQIDEAQAKVDAMAAWRKICPPPADLAAARKERNQQIFAGWSPNDVLDLLWTLTNINNYGAPPLSVAFARVALAIVLVWAEDEGDSGFGAVWDLMNAIKYAKKKILEETYGLPAGSTRSGADPDGGYGSVNYFSQDDTPSYNADDY